VDKLHQHGILVMNMVGAPKHVPKALAAGVDLICAQGGEGMLSCIVFTYSVS
jgi:NAD(P)H-dependent flavin oxidoreductase YrpB (nitropropane dioxygenase family)